jgi:transposase-like protein
MAFAPPYCPNPACPSHAEGRALMRPRSSYRRKCDGRTISRFACDRCKKSCSTQTFRLDYRLRRTDLWTGVFMNLCSKVTLRQSARFHRCNRKTIAARLKLFGEHCKELHLGALELARTRGGIQGSFQLDELETYETDRRLKPVTVPLLVHMPSRCVLHTAVGTLPPRKPLPPRKQKQLERIEAEEGEKRKSESREKVSECFEVLKQITPTEGPVRVGTDEKPTYRAILKKKFGERLVHKRTHSTEPRTIKNPLFLVNHTFAMLRDGLGRLVRRNWGATKEREKLEWHLWLYIGWRNYVRPITNKRPHETAAMVAGLAPRMLDSCELLRWRIFHSTDAQ